MPFCAVPNCDRGSARERKGRQGPAPSFFKVTQTNLKAWNRAVPRADRKLTVKDYVCSDHFHEDQIERFHPDIVVGGLIIKGEPRPPRLKPDAVPSIFKRPNYSNVPEKPKRKPPSERQQLPPRKQISNEEIEEQTNSTEATVEDSAEPETSSQENEEQTNATEVVVEEPETPTTTFVNPSEVKLPGKGWGVHQYDEVHFYTKVDQQCRQTHIFSVKADGSAALMVGKRHITIASLKTTVQNAADIEATLNEAEKLRACEGTGFASFSKDCQGGIKFGVRCKKCRESRKSERRRIKQQQNIADKRRKMINHRAKTHYKVKNRIKQIKQRAKSLKERLKEAYSECRKKREDEIKRAIETLPATQQKAVLACLNASKRKGPHGNRYEMEWIYEAILMRIKSPRLYDHIRARKILSLPSRSTINRYMRKLHPVYGYQKSLFDVLKVKTSDWKEPARQGLLLIDEMKLIPGVSFDRNSLKTIGYTDLPNDDKDSNTMGDHALQVLFQPSTGGWVQSLGCFLTKSNANGDVLSKVVLEGIVLAENAGLRVNGVVTDGAHWNRNMWEKFNISDKTPRCQHPVKENRNLWFLSDWCHLIKCARNCLLPIIPSKKKYVQAAVTQAPNKNDPIMASSKRGKRKASNKDKGEPAVKKIRRLETDQEFEARRQAALKKELKTPDGVIKRSHFTTLYEEEMKMRGKYGVAAMSYVPKWTRQHVFPNGFERMNVKLAYQFFSNSAKTGMEWHRKKGVEGLSDSEPTENFLRLFNDVADAMNSRNSAQAFRRGSKSEEAIKDFLEHHEEWIELVKKNGNKSFFSESTDYGLQVTLQATLELSYYLIDEIGYKYVITSKFNQDAVEQFFAMIRSACGPNTHPDPKLYAQLHRLLSVYNLIKPPKGSNISGGDNIRALLNADDEIADAEKKRKAEIEELLDDVVMFGEASEPLPLPHTLEHSYVQKAPVMEENLLKFMAGFTAARQSKIAKSCDNCLLTFSQFREETGSSHAFTRMKEMYGGYTYASEELSNLVGKVEQAVQECLFHHGVHRDVFITTLKYLKISREDKVGCIDHLEEVTKKIINFYLTMRMFFAADKQNEEAASAKKLSKQYAKQAKMQ